MASPAMVIPVWRGTYVRGEISAERHEQLPDHVLEVRRSLSAIAGERMREVQGGMAIAGEPACEKDYQAELRQRPCSAALQ